MRRVLPCLVILLAFATPASAQLGAPSGVLLSPFSILQSPANYQSFGDRTGGAWAVFMSTQPNSGVYGQHINFDGSFANGFSANPRVLVPANTQANNIACTPDGQGGALLTWFGTNPATPGSAFIALRLRHLDINGGPPAGFPDTGVVVSSIATAAMVVGDGQGGAYVAWEELKGVSNPDIYAQHYDAAGAPLWTPLGSPTGRPVCAVVGLQRLRALRQDGEGGALVVWADSRTSGTVPLYAARLLATGVAGAPWPTNGVRVTPTAVGIRIVGSAAIPGGGLWLAWRDLNVSNQLMGQAVGNDASFAWGALGSLAATVSPIQAEFVPAANNKVFLTWGGADLRCVSLDATGTRTWPEANGRVLFTPTNPTLAVHAVADGQGGQWIAWSFDNAGQSDSYLMTVNNVGAQPVGQPPGGDTLAATPAPEDPVAVIPDPPTAPLVVWIADSLLRVRRIGTLTSGVVGGGPAGGGLSLASPAPNPWRGGPLALRFTGAAGDLTAELFDTAGRRVAVGTIGSRGGAQSATWQVSPAPPPGVYALRLTGPGARATRRIVRIE